MKLAYTHDWLYEVAGAERVLEAMLEVYKGPVYTLFYNDETVDQLGIEDVYASFLNRIPNIEKVYKNFLPLYPLAVNDWNLSDYDVVVSSSHSVAKGFRKRQGQLHICYCHTPMRYIWDLYPDYKKYMPLIKKIPFALTARFLRKWDIDTSKDVDFFLANSQYVAERIKRIYGRESFVIYPPVNIDEFEPEENKSNYYIFIGRLFNAYKRADIVIEAFNNLGKKLIVVGDGDDYQKLREKAKSNIEFTGWLNHDEIYPILRKAKALILPSVEDFGMVSVEAQACGTPVLAYSKGGAKETVIPFKTGVFFPEQTKESIINAVKTLEGDYSRYKVEVMRENVKRFSKASFKRSFEGVLKGLITQNS